METRVCRLYSKGDLRVEREDVSEPQPGQVLVKLGRGGICGSDLHYFKEGGIGQILVREPIILGHELAGTIDQVGQGVETLAIGDQVSINPSQPCGRCKFCSTGHPQHCLHMRFIGSAMYLPHEQGGFRDFMLVPATQCVAADKNIALASLACAEPLAVCLHAAGLAGDLAGKKVLVSGAGPIGALCVAIAKARGAEEVFAVDLHDFALTIAGKMGATTTINTHNRPGLLEPYSLDKGYFDLVFECSAAQKAMETVLQVIRPQGTIIQVGVTGSLPLALNTLVGKEVKLLGSHRFNTEFIEAVAMISSGNIDVTPIITNTFPLEEVLPAFEASTDRSRSIKVQLAFGDGSF